MFPPQAKNNFEIFLLKVYRSPKPEANILKHLKRFFRPVFTKILITKTSKSCLGSQRWILFKAQLYRLKAAFIALRWPIRWTTQRRGFSSTLPFALGLGDALAHTVSAVTLSSGLFYTRTHFLENLGTLWTVLYIMTAGVGCRMKVGYFFLTMCCINSL